MIGSQLELNQPGYPAMSIDKSSSMAVSLNWSGVWELPSTLHTGSMSYLSWYFPRKIFGLSSVWEGVDLYPQEGLQIISYLYDLLSISRGVTLVILHQIDSRIAHHRPRCHLITFGSYCSVISILTTLTGKPLFQKSLMIQYTNKKPYESSFFSHIM